MASPSKGPLTTDSVAYDLYNLRTSYLSSGDIGSGFPFVMLASLQQGWDEGSTGVSVQDIINSINDILFHLKNKTATQHKPIEYWKIITEKLGQAYKLQNRDRPVSPDDITKPASKPPPPTPTPTPTPTPNPPPFSPPVWTPIPISYYNYDIGKWLLALNTQITYIYTVAETTEGYIKMAITSFNGLMGQTALNKGKQNVITQYLSITKGSEQQTCKANIKIATSFIDDFSSNINSTIGLIKPKAPFPISDFPILDYGESSFTQMVVKMGELNQWQNYYKIPSSSPWDDQTYTIPDPIDLSNFASWFISVVDKVKSSSNVWIDWDKDYNDMLTGLKSNFPKVIDLKNPPDFWKTAIQRWRGAIETGKWTAHNIKLEIDETKGYITGDIANFNTGIKGNKGTSLSKLLTYNSPDNLGTIYYDIGDELIYIMILQEYISSEPLREDFPTSVAEFASNILPNGLAYIPQGSKISWTIRSVAHIDYGYWVTFTFANYIKKFYPVGYPVLTVQDIDWTWGGTLDTNYGDIYTTYSNLLLSASPPISTAEECNDFLTGFLIGPPEGSGSPLVGTITDLFTYCSNDSISGLGNINLSDPTFQDKLNAHISKVIGDIALITAVNDYMNAHMIDPGKGPYVPPTPSPSPSPSGDIFERFMSFVKEHPFLVGGIAIGFLALVIGGGVYLKTKLRSG
jgi:hypothetical protein